MRIDESSINHNALRLIDEAIDTIYESDTGDGPDINTMLMAVGRIGGASDLAEALKAVLKE